MSQPESDVTGATADQPAAGPTAELPRDGHTAELPRVGDAPPPRPGDTAEQDVFFGAARVPPPRVPPDQLPPIDPSELAGLYDDSRGSAVRRLSPLQDEPSLLVVRYLFPAVKFRGEWRRHVIHLVGPIMTGVIASIGLGLLAGFLQAANFASSTLVATL